MDGVLPEEAEPPPEPERRRRKRRLIWPLLLASALAAASWTIAQAATLPPLPLADAAAHGLVTDAAQAPVEAVMPTAGPLASAKPAPFGPQIEVILPPPPPPPASSGKKNSPQQKKAAAAALTTTQYCDGKYGAKSSVSSVEGLLTAANAERANFGLAPLSWNGDLASSAQHWSNAMAAGYTAAAPTAGFKHGEAPTPGGQNLAYYWASSPPTLAAAMWAAHSDPKWGWMVSSDHCKNILRSSFTSMGAATTQTSDGLAWFTTVDFQ